MATEFAQHLFDRMAETGENFGQTMAGYHAMDSLRQEKGFRHWGHDIGDQDTPLESGLGFAVAWDKPGGFIGRDALLKQRDEGVRRRLAQFLIKDPEPLLYGNEPIWRDGEIVGYLTTAMYGHTLGGAMGLGYVENPDLETVTADFISAGTYEIEIAGELFAATVSLKPLYDPKSDRVKA